jgi:hypothetical protein
MARRKGSVGPGEPPRPPRRAAESRGNKTDGYFNAWLEKGLHELFDNVAKEPLPDSLLSLLDPNTPKE